MTSLRLLHILLSNLFLNLSFMMLTIKNINPDVLKRIWADVKDVKSLKLIFYR